MVSISVPLSTILSLRYNSHVVICEIIPSLCPNGGAEHVFADLVRALNRRQDVRVFCVLLYSEPCHLLDEITADGVPCYQLGKKRGLDLACARKLKKLLKELKPDVVHSHLDSLVTLFPSIRSRADSTRFFHTFHGMIDPSRRSVRLHFYKSLVKHKRVFPIGVSRQVSNSISLSFGCPVVPFVMNGVDLCKHPLGPRPSERHHTFVHVGRFVPVKNHAGLLRCFAKMPDTADLLLAGSGPLEKDIRELASSLGLENRVCFLGEITDSGSVIRDSKILLLPSLSEGNPIVINEAIAAGTFVVANNVGGIGDVLKDTLNGLLVTPPDDATFEQAMLAALSECRDSSYEFDERDRERVSVERSAQDYIQLFGEASFK